MPSDDRTFRDKAVADYHDPDLNPYLKLHHSWGRPVLTADQAAACRGKWAAEYGRDADLNVEIGPGNGFFLSEMASRMPQHNWLGIEIRFKRVILTAKKLRARQAESQARVCRYDASALHDLFAPGEVSTLYINHPDPWPKDRHAKNRLLGPAFLDRVAPLLAPGAEIRLKTDHLINVEALSEAATGHPLYRVLARCDDVSALGAPWGEDAKTNYQRKYDAKGQPVYAVQVKRVP